MLSNLLLLTLLSPNALADQAPSANLFKLSLYQEPKNLDPQLTSSSSSNYLFQSLHRNLLSFDNTKGLLPDLADKCSRPSPKKLICTLKKDLKWSDGSPLTCADFLRAYQVILQNPLASSTAQDFFSIKNAKEVLTNAKKIEDLGIRCASDKKIEYEFNKEDPEFEYNLTRTASAPRSASENPLFSGPYKLKTWTKNIKIEIEKNNFYPLGNPKRPNVEFYFIAEDFTALQFFQKNKLDFLRRLPTSLYPDWKSKPEFQSYEILRFDYYGFSTAHLNQEQRLSLQQSLDLEDLKKIYHSIGTPGCAPLPASFFAQDKIPCVKMDLTKALAEKKKVSAWPKDLSFAFSSQGGDDSRRLAEWLQSQWSENLQVQVKIKSFENKIFVSELKKQSLSSFRKGVSLDRPTCLAAVEIFSKGHPENYIGLSSDHFEKLLLKLRTAPSAEKKRLSCTEAVEFLIQNAYLVPSGRFDFFTLLNPKLNGFRINWLNQMDLASIHWK